MNCESCTLTVCSPRCPLAADGGDTPACALCEEPLFAGDGHFAFGGHRMCAACADRATVDELLHLADLSNMKELLLLLGFVCNE